MRKVCLVMFLSILTAGCSFEKTVIETVIEPVKHESKKNFDNSKPTTYIKTDIEGTDGEVEVVYEIVYRGSKEVSRSEISRETLIEPITWEYTVGSAKQIEKLEITDYHREMMLATAQLALKRNNIDDNTSSQVESWDISTQQDEESISWIVTTETVEDGRIKFIFEWSGNDEDDILLTYLLFGGNEVINFLQ